MNFLISFSFHALQTKFYELYLKCKTFEDHIISCIHRFKGVLIVHDMDISDTESPDNFFKKVTVFLIGCFGSVKDCDDISDSQRKQVKSFIGEINQSYSLDDYLWEHSREYLKYLNYFDERDFSKINDVFVDFARAVRKIEIS